MRLLMIIPFFLFLNANPQTTKIYDLISELDRYEHVIPHFETARIKSVKIKVLTEERPGHLLFDKATGRIVFLWKDVDRTGSLVLDRTDILSIEEDPRYPGMYLHIHLANPAKFGHHLFDVKKKGPQPYLRFNAKKLSQGLLTRNLDVTRQQISDMLFQLPARGTDRHNLPDAIKGIQPGSTMDRLQERFPEGILINSQEGHALFHVILAPERHEYLVAESINGAIFRITRLLFAEKPEDVDRRYAEFCEAYQEKHGYAIDQTKPVFSLHKVDRVFRIASYGSRRPMVQEVHMVHTSDQTDRKIRFSEPISGIATMYETDAPGSVEDLTGLLGLDGKRFQSYTVVELVDYAIWAAARGITKRDLANQTITSEDL